MGASITQKPGCIGADRTRCVTPLARCFINAGETATRVAEVNHASDATRGAAGNASEGVGSAGPERSTDSSTVGDTSPRDALRGKRHAVTFPCALSAVSRV